MKNNKQNKTKPYIKYFVILVFFLFIKIFRVKKNMPKEVQKLKPPYLVLGNHVGYWDPFVIAYFLPHFTRFVSSDTTVRKPLLKFFLTRLGTIPIKKNTRDTQVIRDILTVIRQGEIVGIFPEAVRNWAGSSFKMDPSIAKLIKLLNVPVVVPILKGMNLFNPRWSKKIRYTQVEVDYHLLFNNGDLKKLSSEEVFRQLSEVFQHDEVAYQQVNKNKIYSKHKAEYISYALYVCPNCHAIDSFITKGNDFECINCEYDIHIESYGFFERISNGKLFYDNIRDWYNWEEKWMLNHVYKAYDEKNEAIIFEDRNSKLYHSNTGGKMNFIDDINVKLYIDKIVIESLSGKDDIIFNFDDLQTINPQLNDQVDIFYKDEAYRFVGGRLGVSGLKWEVAVNAIWKKMSQNHKLSVYIDQEQ